MLLSATSFAGPFAAGGIALQAVKTPVRNSTDGPLTFVSARVTPLISERTSLAPGAGQLVATLTPGPVELGGIALATIDGTVPARPGSYLAELVAQAEGGASIATPIRVEVAASPFWGALCLLIGLSLLGIIKLLTGEGDVEELTRQTINERSAIHAEWKRNPPPSRSADTVTAIDRNIDEAVRSLAAPRGFSVVDRRIADANASMARAREAAAQLSEAMERAPLGAAEATDLQQDWEVFKAQATALAAPAPASTPASEGLAGHADALVAKARIGLLAAPASWDQADIGAQMERIRLTLAAGEAPRARAMALATRAWMRRSADDLDKRYALQLGLWFVVENMKTTDARLRRRASDDTIPAQPRASWIARLDAADAQLASGSSLNDLAEAVRIVEETETQSMRDQENAMLARLKQAEDKAGDELSLASVNAVFAEMGPPDKLTTAERADGVGKAFEVWRGLLGAVHDDAARASLAAALESGAAASGRQDASGMKQAMKTAQETWQAYTPKHVAAAGAVIVGPVCTDWKNQGLQQLAVAEGQVKLRSGRPEVAEWDKRLDRAKRALQSVASMDVNCMSPLTTASGEINRVSEETFQRLLKDSGIPMSARLDAAERSGAAAAIAAVQRLASEPRDLQLMPETAESDRVEGQPILFTLVDLDPNWGSGVDVTLDWGDKSSPYRTDAEKLRQGDRLEHVYRAIGAVHPTATAVDGRETVGASSSDTFIGPSPANAAKRAADFFLSSQFWLALLIASVVYYWRFQSGTVIFGSSGVHYVQAFALGFAAYAAVADLPKALAEFALK